MKHGDLCRAKCGAPARYLDQGKCLYVSAMCNDLSIDDAVPAIGGEQCLPTPSDERLEGASVGLSYGMVQVFKVKEGRA